MASLDQVIAQIRFALDQLSVKNGHHEFEHLCRHLTKARICSNVLPSTGPVAAGGDQGRDFETFRTYLSSTSIADSTFVGLISQKPLAFACSLEKKEKIPGKIRKDVKTIMSSGSTVEGVYYFCRADIETSKRHKLQEWAQNNYSIDLVIFNGETISELLSDRDIFWIAQKFLSVPSEIYPRSPVDDGNEWYQKTLANYKKTEKQFSNYSDFSNIRIAARHTAYSTELRQDLPFWLCLLERFIEPDVQKQLRRRAIYEIAFISFKGMGTLLGQEEKLREYFNAIPDLEETSDLEDAFVLLNVCISAQPKNSIALTVDETGAWQDTLITKVNDELKKAGTANKKCLLLDIRGHLSLSVNPRQPKRPELEDAFVWWVELIKIVKDAPMFPLERFADRLTQYLEFLDEPSNYDDLTQQVDSLLSKRFGAFIAADKCRDRAVALYDKGKILKAIGQLHKAKFNWFAAETLYGSLLSMLFVSQCYLELGLSFAGKYYALAVASFAWDINREDLKPLLSRALIQAAKCDYYQGSWCGFIDLMDAAIEAHSRFSEDAPNLVKHEDLYRAVFRIITLRAITERLAPELLELVDQKVQEWKLGDAIEKLRPRINETWDDKSIEDTWVRIEKKLFDAPFSDLGQTRVVTWSELGIKWSVIWKNDYHTTKSVEQFIAVLQIFLAELANVDLCLLKTDININVSTSNEAHIEIASLPSHAGRNWIVRLPNYSIEDIPAMEHLQRDVLYVGSNILSEASLLLDEAYQMEIDKCFQNGISMKAFVAKPYELIYWEFISPETFESSDRASKTKPIPSHCFIIKEYDELAWFEGPGPGYSKNTASEMLRNRYRNVMPYIRYTLKQLLSSSDFKSLVDQLHAEGWLDWHVLNTLADVKANTIINKGKEIFRNERIKEHQLQAMLDEPENKNSILLPTSCFTEDKFRFCQITSMLSTLKSYGLKCRQLTPDFMAIEHFLRFRYNYWTDDIKHNDPFVWETSV